MIINIAELTAAVENVSMLDALELREQAGLSIPEVGAVIERIADDDGPDFDLLGDMDAMKALTAALWLGARAAGETPPFRVFMGGLKLRELGEAGTELAARTEVVQLPDHGV